MVTPRTKVSKDKGIWVEGPEGHGMKGHLVFLSLPGLVLPTFVYWAQ